MREAGWPDDKGCVSAAVVVVRVHLKPRIGGILLRKLTVSQVTKL